jgi:hypothetical protein
MQLNELFGIPVDVQVDNQRTPITHIAAEMLKNCEGGRKFRWPLPLWKMAGKT